MNSISNVELRKELRNKNSDQTLKVEALIIPQMYVILHLATCHNQRQLPMLQINAFT